MTSVADRAIVMNRAIRRHAAEVSSLLRRYCCIMSCCMVVQRATLICFPVSSVAVAEISYMDFFTIACP